jgi:hypothetical protein
MEILGIFSIFLSCHRIPIPSKFQWPADLMDGLTPPVLIWFEKAKALFYQMFLILVILS